MRRPRGRAEGAGAGVATRGRLAAGDAAAIAWAPTPVTHDQEAQAVHLLHHLSHRWSASEVRATRMPPVRRRTRSDLCLRNDADEAHSASEASATTHPRPRSQPQVADANQPPPATTAGRAAAVLCPTPSLRCQFQRVPLPPPDCAGLVVPEAGRAAAKIEKNAGIPRPIPPRGRSLRSPYILPSS